MALRHWFIHTCTIQEHDTTRLATGELSKAWSNKDTAVDCRFVVKSEAVASEGTSGQVVTTYLMLFPAGTNVTNVNRISNIRRKKSNVLVDNGPFQIEQVLPRNAKSERHISLMLEKVKGNE